MKTAKVVFFKSIMLSLISASTLYDCYNTALEYKNTCNGAPYYPEDWNTFTTEDVTCTQMTKCPFNGGSPGNCKWVRKLCVTC